MLKSSTNRICQIYQQNINKPKTVASIISQHTTEMSECLPLFLFISFYYKIPNPPYLFVFTKQSQKRNVD